MAFALGLGDQVVGVSHECDYPTAVRDLPRVTRSTIDPTTMSSAEIDRVVSEAFAAGRATYTIDEGLLADLRPDLVLTQDLCEVCAIGGSDVRQAAARLAAPPRILSLEPHTVDDVLASLRLVGEAAGVGERADRVAGELHARIAAVTAATANVERPRVLCLEWLDPAWIAGHWMPEVVELAGGTDVLGAAGERSRRASWDEIEATQPDVAVVMPCGFGLEAGLEASAALTAIPQLLATPAFRTGRTYVVDASSYYSRSGPRIVDGVELMARMLHPEVFGEPLPAESGRRIELQPAAESLSPR